MIKTFHISFVLIFFYISCNNTEVIFISDIKKVGQPITIDFIGPHSSEQDEDNPFMNYRLEATFKNGDHKLVIPGFYAADGDAAETSSDAGNVWRVKFTPPKHGVWDASISFEYGKNIAIDEDVKGSRVFFDGEEFQFKVEKIDPYAPGFYSKGKLIKTDGHFLQHSGNGEYFIKCGAGSPENFLAYIDFDGTSRMNVGEQREGEAFTTESLHRYEPHEKDSNPDDDLWQNEKGKGILGALNYLSYKGMNSVYMLTMNIGGDGKDIWPYTHPEERFRFDCSKLAQWDRVFDHMDKKGLLLHILFQETENELLLDGGDTGPERKAYLREMIARFGHHLGVIWNMGEENGPADWAPEGQTTEQQKAMLDYVAAIDPYDNLRVIHSHSNETPRRELFSKLMNHLTLDGMSMQIDKRQDSYEETKYWIEKTSENKKPWNIYIDEIGHFSIGADPDDKPNNNQDSLRREVTWGNLMAGGQGVEWYFGYLNAHNDLGCEDWRSRDNLWDQTAFALDFFKNEIPFWEMDSHNEIITTQNAKCLAKKDHTYVVYLEKAEPFVIDLSKAYSKFNVFLYNPRQGGPLIPHSKSTITGGSEIQYTEFPSDEDWVVLFKKA